MNKISKLWRKKKRSASLRYDVLTPTLSHAHAQLIPLRVKRVKWKTAPRCSDRKGPMCERPEVMLHVFHKQLTEWLEADAAFQLSKPLTISWKYIVSFSWRNFTNDTHLTHLKPVTETENPVAFDKTNFWVDSLLWPVSDTVRLELVAPTTST